MNNKLRKITYAGVLAAFVFVGTELHVPTAIGHVNLGDAIILISSFILGPFAFLPAAIGSATADLVGGYAQYVIPTFVIKGLMGLVAGAFFKAARHEKLTLPLKLLGAALAELIMVAGYFAFESLPFMYGVAAAVGSLIPNLIQGAAAIAIALPLTYVKQFEKVRF